MNLNKKQQGNENLGVNSRDIEFYKRIYKVYELELFIEFVSKNKVTIFDNQFVKSNLSKILENNYTDFVKYEKEIREINNNYEDTYYDYEEEIENILDVLYDGLKRFEHICKEKNVRLYSMPLLVFGINTSDFYCSLDSLINSLILDFSNNIIKEELDFIFEQEDYTKVSLVYNINKSNIEIINRVFINFDKNYDGRFKNNLGTYITQVLCVDDKDDYEKLANILLNLNISSSELNLLISKNLRECEKNIDRGLVRLPDSYLIYPHR